MFLRQHRGIPRRVGDGVSCVRNSPLSPAFQNQGGDRHSLPFDARSSVVATRIAVLRKSPNPIQGEIAMRTTNHVTARMNRVIPFLVVVALLLSPLSLARRPGTGSPDPEQAERRKSNLLRRRWHAPRFDGEVCVSRCNANLRRSDAQRRQRRQRSGAGLSAQHGGRLVHACNGNLSERTRLDQQHLLPKRR